MYIVDKEITSEGSLRLARAYGNGDCAVTI